MMISEFIELTGFEPTLEEYREIEEEYMGCDENKQVFCKKWVKNGGIQRISRIRTRKIEQLEANYASLDRQTDTIIREMDRVIEEYRRADAISKKVVDEKNDLITDLEHQLKEMTRKYEELKNAIKIIKEA